MRKKSNESEVKRERAPATTPEEVERRMISLATDLARKQLEKGTASSQVITHYLKLGTIREQLDNERLRNENKLLKAKTDALNRQGDLETIVTKAMEALKHYNGGD